MPHMEDVVVTKIDIFLELRDLWSKWVTNQIRIQIIN